jgi:putative membrane protein
MLIVSVVIAALAAALHVYIFSMESLAWDGPAARKTFGPATTAEVEATRPLAYNQGFYNLFLAIVTVIGIVFVLVSTSPVGPALILVGTGSMLAAAIVLFLSLPSKRSAAIRQGGLPLLAVIATIIALAV